jgi:hypothetical protein
MLIQSPKLPFLEFFSWRIVDPDRLTEADMLASYEQLNIAPVDRSQTIDGIDLLALDFGLSLTSRMLAESIDVNQSEIQASKDIRKKPRRDLGGL